MMNQPSSIIQNQFMHINFGEIDENFYISQSA